MTLCIAAKCEQKGEPRIVLCTDWKSENPLGTTTQTFDKFRPIKLGWVALMAGRSSRAFELVRVFRSHLKSKKITEDNALREIKAAAQTQAANLRDEFVRLTLGISYEDFRNSGLLQYGEKVFKETVDEIRKINFGACLIIAGFVPPNKPLIFVVNPNGVVTVEEHFAVIGDGKLVAIPSLSRREYDSSTPLAKAIYQVYEAKTLGETVGSVGDDTSLDVLKPNGEMQSMSKAGYAYLDGLLKKYGPKRRVKSVELRGKFFTKFDYTSEY